MTLDPATLNSANGDDRSSDALRSDTSSCDHTKYYDDQNDGIPCRLIHEGKHMTDSLPQIRLDQLRGIAADLRQAISGNVSLKYVREMTFTKTIQVQSFLQSNSEFFRWLSNRDDCEWMASARLSKGSVIEHIAKGIGIRVQPQVATGYELHFRLDLDGVPTLDDFGVDKKGHPVLANHAADVFEANCLQPVVYKCESTQLAASVNYAQWAASVLDEFCSVVECESKSLIDALRRTAEARASKQKDESEMGRGDKISENNIRIYRKILEKYSRDVTSTVNTSTWKKQREGFIEWMNSPKSNELRIEFVKESDDKELPPVIEKERGIGGKSEFTLDCLERIKKAIAYRDNKKREKQ